MPYDEIFPPLLGNEIKSHLRKLRHLGFNLRGWPVRIHHRDRFERITHNRDRLL